MKPAASTAGPPPAPPGAPLAGREPPMGAGKAQAIEGAARGWSAGGAGAAREAEQPSCGQRKAEGGAAQGCARRRAARSAGSRQRRRRAGIWGETVLRAVQVGGGSVV